MERRIERADCDRQPIHRLEEAKEIVTLHRKQFVQRCTTLRFALSEDHLAHEWNTLFGEEHVFSTAQADSFSAKGARLDRIARNVRVSAHSDAAEGLGDCHEAYQIGIVSGCRYGGQFALD